MLPTSSHWSRHDRQKQVVHERTSARLVPALEDPALPGKLPHVKVRNSVFRQRLPPFAVEFDPLAVPRDVRNDAEVIGVGVCAALVGHRNKHTPSLAESLSGKARRDVRGSA